MTDEISISIWDEWTATQPITRDILTWADICKTVDSFWTVEMEAKPMAQLRYHSKVTYDNRIFKATVKKDQPTRSGMWDDEFIHSKTLELFGGLTLYFTVSAAGEQEPIRWYNRIGEIRTRDDVAVTNQFKAEWLENIELVCGEIITLRDDEED